MSWLQGNTGSFFCISKFIKMGITSLGIGTFLSINDFKVSSIIKNIIKVMMIFSFLYGVLFYFASPSLASKLSLIVQILKMWPYAMYYILSEMWGAYALSLLFWNFSNYQVKSNETIRIYPFLVLVGQFGQITAAEVVQRFSHSKNLVFAVTIATLISGIIIFITHEYLFRTTGREVESTTVKLKKKPSFNESLKAIMSSKSIMLTSTIIVLYGITCNLIETYWKTRLRDLSKLLFPNDADHASAYFSYNQAAMTKYVGFLSIITALLSGYLLKKMGWRFSALITPLAMLIGGFFFFGLDLVHDIIHMVEGNHVHLIKAAMYFGMMILIFVKATKYTLFDNTKEIFLVSLPNEIKSQSKVADSLAGRFGKFLGAGILLFPTFIALPLSAISVRTVIFFLMIALSLFWTFNVFKMNTIKEENDKEIAAKKNSTN
jgi:AAA family ATP:ADP antiporter